MRPTYIVIRQSPDWRTQTYADLESTRAFCRSIGRRDDLIIDFVKLWDRTFPATFFATRQAMKEISLKNLMSVRGAAIVPLDSVRDVIRPDAFYLFIDDDDWYDPDIALHLQSFDPRKCAAVVWRQATSTHEITYYRDGYFWSNNYAVSGSYLLHRRKNLDRVSQHYEAQGTFNCPNLKHRIRRIGYLTYARHVLMPGYRCVIGSTACWSMKNEHPAATVALERLGDRAAPEDLKRLVRMNVDPAHTCVLPAGLQWAKPLMGRTIGFFSMLLERTS